DRPGAGAVVGGAVAFPVRVTQRIGAVGIERERAVDAGAVGAGQGALEAAGEGAHVQAFGRGGVVDFTQHVGGVFVGDRFDGVGRDGRRGRRGVFGCGGVGRGLAAGEGNRGGEQGGGEQGAVRHRLLHRGNSRLWLDDVSSAA